jgi:hypothetical protein
LKTHQKSAHGSTTKRTTLQWRPFNEIPKVAQPKRLPLHSPPITPPLIWKHHYTEEDAASSVSSSPTSTNFADSQQPLNKYYYFAQQPSDDYFLTKKYINSLEEIPSVSTTLYDPCHQDRRYFFPQI